MQSLPITRAKAVFARNLAANVLVTGFLLALIAIPNGARAQTQVFFSSAPSPGTIEPIGTPYFLTVQGTDDYGVNGLGVKDITTGGTVIGWPEPGCGPGGIHTFMVANYAAPPPGWTGFLWAAEMQGCDNPSFWFSTYSTAGLYPT